MKTYSAKETLLQSGESGRDLPATGRTFRGHTISIVARLTRRTGHQNKESPGGDVSTCPEQEL